MPRRPADPDPRPGSARPDTPEPRAGRRSLHERFWDWITEEVSPDSPPPRTTPVPLAVARPAPDRTAGRAAPPGARPRPEGTGRRRRDRRAAQRGWAGHARVPAAALGVVALAALGVVVLTAHGAVPTVARPKAAVPAPAGKAAATPPAQRPPAGTVPGSPDCAVMHMEPVPPAGVSAYQPIAGLCYSLGDGRSWRVGCAPGFRVPCDPALQRVLSCVRQVGARQGGTVTDADVWTCAGVPDAHGAAAGPAVGTAA